MLEAPAGARIVEAGGVLPVGGTCSSQIPRPCVATRRIEPSSRIWSSWIEEAGRPVAEFRPGRAPVRRSKDAHVRAAEDDAGSVGSIAESLGREGRKSVRARRPVQAAVVAAVHARSGHRRDARVRDRSSSSDRSPRCLRPNSEAAPPATHVVSPVTRSEDAGSLPDDQKERIGPRQRDRRDVGRRDPAGRVRRRGRQRDPGGAAVARALQTRYEPV